MIYIKSSVLRHLSQKYLLKCVLQCSGSIYYNLLGLQLFFLYFLIKTANSCSDLSSLSSVTLWVSLSHVCICCKPASRRNSSKRSRRGGTHFLQKILKPKVLLFCWQLGAGASEGSSALEAEEDDAEVTGCSSCSSCCSSC